MVNTSTVLQMVLLDELTLKSTTWGSLHKYRLFEYIRVKSLRGQFRRFLELICLYGYPFSSVCCFEILFVTRQQSKTLDLELLLSYLFTYASASQPYGKLTLWSNAAKQEPVLAQRLSIVRFLELTALRSPLH